MRKILNRKDGRPWTWGWAFRQSGAAWFGIAVAAAILFRALGLGWIGVVVMLAISFGAGFAAIAWRQRRVRQTPIDLLSNRVQIAPSRGSNHVFNCPTCGWRGVGADLKRAADRD